MQKAKQIIVIFMVVMMVLSTGGPALSVLMDSEQGGIAFAASESTSKGGSETKDDEPSVDGSSTEDVNDQIPGNGSEEEPEESQTTGNSGTQNQADSTDVEPDNDQTSKAESSSDVDTDAIEERTVIASVKPETLYENDKDGKKKETAELSAFQNFWNALLGRRAALNKEERDDNYVPFKVRITGKLPEKATAEVTYIDTDEDNKPAETAMYAFSLKIYDADGKVYIPEEPVSIEIKGRTLTKAVKDDKTLLLYSYQVNEERAGTYEEKYNKPFWAADVLVYRDGTGEDEWLAYKPYDKKDVHRDGEDAVRYTEDKDGIGWDENTDTLVFEYSFGHSLDVTDGMEEAKKDTDRADFVLAVQDPEKEKAALKKEKNEKNKATDKTATYTKTATNNKTYKITVQYDGRSGIPADAELEVIEISDGDDSYDDMVVTAAKKLGQDPEIFEYAHAFDISLVDPETGMHYQPDKDVKVSIDLLKEDIGKNDAVQVVHLPDAEANMTSGEASDVENAEIMKSSVNNEVVEFKTDGFSVYVVVKNQPSYQYTFIDPDGKEYLSLRQILLDGDSLIEPTAPSDDGRVFDKWVAVDSPEQSVGPESPAFSGWGPVGPIEEADEYPIPKYLKAVYKTDKQVHIRWHDQEDDIIQQETVTKGTNIDPEESPYDVSYTAKQTVSGEYLVFLYWTEDLYDLVDGEPVKYTGGAANEDIDLYPYCAPAHWLYYNGNSSKTDPDRPDSVPYSSPLLVLEGNTSFQPDDIPHDFSDIKGYTFKGWYADPVREDVQVFDANGRINVNNFKKFYTGGNSLEYDPTVYAHWTPDSQASYSVAYYVQNPDNEPGSEKTYVFQVRADTGTAAVGSTVSLDQQRDTVEHLVQITSGFDANGLELNTNKSVPVRVSADGSTVLNVYFDRKPFTLRFTHNTTRTGELTDITIYALYGHNTTEDWPGNEHHSKQWKQWVGNQFSNQHNVTQMPYMPAEDRWYSDSGVVDPGANNASTYVRNAYIEKIDQDGTSTHEGYEISAEKEDRRAFTSGNVGISADALALFEGFELVRLEGAKNQTTQAAADYQWYKNNTYKNPQISEWTTKATDTFKYFRQSTDPARTFHADAFYVRNRHKLTVKCILDGQTKYTKVFNSVKFGTELYDKETKKLNSDYIYSYESDHDNVKNIDNPADAWWFYDEELTIPVDFESLSTMPDRDIELYEGLRTSYPIAVDPNGGELLGGSAGSTWFNLSKNENISEYTVTRDYVEASEVGQTLAPGEGYVYKYSRIYDSLDGPDGAYGKDPDDRTALYIDAEETEQGVYVQSPGYWEFQYWYKVTASYENGTFVLNEKPSDKNRAYNFRRAVDGPVYLKARWTRTGDYTIKYNADYQEGGSTVAVRAPVDNETYREGSRASIKASSDHPSGYQFRFWYTEPQQTVGDISGVPEDKKLYPNSSLLITRSLAPGQASDAKKTVTLYAWYETGKYPDNNIAEYKFYVQDEDGNWNDGEGDDDKYYYIQAISSGEELIYPTTPEDQVTGRNGSFVGWFTDRECRNRFDGFGRIGAPQYTKLYAGFSKIYSATYYTDVDEASKPKQDRTIITNQTYREGDVLDATKVERDGAVDEYVAFWSTDPNAKPSDIDDPDKNIVGYKGKSKKSFSPQGFTTDLELYPIVGNVLTLTFDSQGGSYVAPMEFPRKVGHWRPAPNPPTRKGYIFDGWWTAPEGVPDTDIPTQPEGGAQYKFDRTLESFTQSCNRLRIPTTLYAHWKMDPNNPPSKNVTVNYWVQNTDRTGYILYKSEIHDNGGEGYSVGSSFSISNSNSKRQPAYGMQGYKTFASDSGDDSAYFEISDTDSDDNPVSKKSDTTITIPDDGAALYNIYYNRKVYKLKFQPDNTYTDTELVGKYRNWHAIEREWRSDDPNEQSVRYSIDGKFSPSSGITPSSDGTYSIDAWLGMDSSATWPKENAVLDASHTDNTKSYLSLTYSSTDRDGHNHAGEAPGYVNGTHFIITTKQGYEWYNPWTGNGEQNNEFIWGNGYDFSGWTEDSSSTFINRRDLQTSITRMLIPDPSAQGFTFTADYAKYETKDAKKSDVNDNPVTVKYFTVDANGNPIEQPQYEQTVYGVTGTGTGSDWKPNTAGLNKIKGAKASIPGYQYDDQYGGSGYTSEEIPQQGFKYEYYYSYKMPHDYEYEHYVARGIIIDIWYTPDDFKDIVLKANGSYYGYDEETPVVREGQFSLAYRNNNVYREHTVADAIYRHNVGTNPNMNDPIGVSAFRSMIDVPIDPDSPDAGYFAGDHLYKRLRRVVPIRVDDNEYYVNLFYKPDSHDLTLKNGIYVDDKGNTKTLEGDDKVLEDVPYTTYLTNAFGKGGYIEQNYPDPPLPDGYEFAYWSLSIDSDVPFEGIMPSYDLTLYAHYKLKTYSVTTQGVDRSGLVKRKGPDEEGRKAPDVDGKGVLKPWGEGRDYTNSKEYNTQLREFTLPSPVLESNEVFKGWKRVMSDGSLSTGYVSPTTRITANTVVVPDILYNKVGYVEYNKNGDDVSGDVPPRDGGYYSGGYVIAADGAGLSKQYTLGDKTYTLKFVSWNTKADGSGTIYYPGDMVKLPEKGTTTLYAQFTKVRLIYLIYHLKNEYPKIDETDAPYSIGVNEFLPAVEGGTVIVDTESIPGETVVKVAFPEFLDTDNTGKKYPNMEYDANKDGEGNAFKLDPKFESAHAGWTEKKGGFNVYVHPDDTIRVNTKNADENMYIHLYPIWTPICKVVDRGVELPFPTLESAYAYIILRMGGKGTIQMLVDYDIPFLDILSINDGDDVTLTTAHSGTYKYKHNNRNATIKRSFNGGSLFTNNGTFTLTNITLDGNNNDGLIMDTKNYTDSDGGLVKVNKGTLNINSGTVMQNSLSTGSGGAVAVLNGTALNISDARFDNCRSYVYGGAVYANTLTTGVTIEGNYTSATSPGTVFNECETLCYRVLDNTKGGGGGLYASKNCAKLNVTGKENGSENNVSHYGVSIVGCKVRGHADKQGGGGIMSSSPAPNIKNCKFDTCKTLMADNANNYSMQGGGLFLCWQNPSIIGNIDNCYFDSCIARGGGGGMEADQVKTLNVSNTTFVDCYTGITDLGPNTKQFKGGGGVNLYSCTTSNFSNCTFTRCKSKGENGGGGLRADTATLSLDTCSFVDCEAKYGGGISMGNGNGTLTATMKGCTITGCKADKTNDTKGGAIYIYKKNNKSTLKLSDDGFNTIKGNSAKEGAGIYVNSGCTVQLGGTVDFGGSGVNSDGSLDTDGTKYNFSTSALPNNSKNGGKSYTKARQDIYIVDSMAPHTGIQVYSALNMDPGTIWVWAVDADHYVKSKQFAVFAESLRNTTDNSINMSDADKVKTYESFRNARPDSLTQWKDEVDYLTGTEGELFWYINWTGSLGSRRVILRKVTKSGSVYNSNTTAELRITTNVSEDAYYDGENYKSAEAGGVFWVGNMPYGTYIIEEKNPHKFYYLKVSGNGIQYPSADKEYDSWADAKQAAGN